MINYNVTGPKRKKLVRILSDLTGQDSKYLGMPSCAFQVGEYTVSKVCEITPTPPEDIIQRLAAYGFGGEKKEDGTIITIPREDMTDTAVLRFENMVISKKPLLRQALNVQNTLPMEVTEDAIIIRWFETEEPDDLEAVKILIDAMIRHAKKVKRISPRPVSMDNPKYNFRVFLNSLGFIGDEYKDLRRVFLKHLEGSSARRHGIAEAPEEDGIDASLRKMTR